jgi:hypothetical protein
MRWHDGCSNMQRVDRDLMYYNVELDNTSVVKEITL